MDKRSLKIVLAALVVAASARRAAAVGLEGAASAGTRALDEAAVAVKTLLASRKDDPAQAKQKLLDEKLLSAVSTVNIAEIRRLVGMGANPNAFDDYHFTPLTTAVYDHGDPDVINTLLELGAKPDFKGVCDKTALHAAGDRGRLEAAQILVKRGAAFDAKDCLGATPLVEAAANNQPDVFQYLLGLGADPNAADWLGKTTFILAAGLFVKPENNQILAGLLADKRTDVNAADRDGMTALKYAAKGGSLDLVKLLLAAPGIDVNNAAGGVTALFLADLNQRQDVADLLRAAGARQIASR